MTSPLPTSSEVLEPDLQDDAAEWLKRYAELNRSFEQPLILHLTQRGIFSEVNGVIDAMLFALVHRRRLAIWEQGFNHLRWSDYFASALEAPEESLLASIAGQQQMTNAKSKPFRRLLAWVETVATSAALLRVDELGIEGHLFDARRAIALRLCQPSKDVRELAHIEMGRLSLEPGRFAAVHIRRGDKIHPRPGHAVEGEDTPIDHVQQVLTSLAPELRDLFVLTDDIRAAQELERVCRENRVVSICPPDAVGHHQPQFNAAPPAEKAATALRLAMECVIATRSAAFAGGFKSNVARFVATVHANPARCVSTDSKLVPWP